MGRVGRGEGRVVSCGLDGERGERGGWGEGGEL